MRERFVDTVTSAYSLHPGTMVTNLTTSSLNHDLTSPCSSFSSAVPFCDTLTTICTSDKVLTVRCIAGIFRGLRCSGSWQNYSLRIDKFILNKLQSMSVLVINLSETYDGRFACCPLVSHVECTCAARYIYVGKDGTVRRTDVRTPDRCLDYA